MSEFKLASPFQFRVLSTEQEKEWIEILGRVVRHDFHALPQYHRLEERRVKAVAQLFTYCEGDYVIALPLLLRPIGEPLPGWSDATSVYGYGGPIASHEKMPETVIRKFQVALGKELVKRRVVAVFSSLHPLIAQHDLLAGLGQYRVSGQTVSIDLTLPSERQWAQYRDNYKRRINKQRREGIVTCPHDQEECYLGEFCNIYEETMRRVNARQRYFFGGDYFRQLACELGPVLHVFVAIIGCKAAAAGLFTIRDGIVQYHLGGTRDEFLKLSPMLLLIDTVRLWANEIGAREFHLGGGVGANEDSLFHHKTGFSNQRHSFATWRWIVAPEIYHNLCEWRTRMNELQGLEPASADYFPVYRCPAASRVRLKPDGTEVKNIEPQIYLSPPHLGEAELELVKEAFASNWIAPLGPHVDGFEKEFAEYLGVAYAAALSSGTAAIHLALWLLGCRFRAMKCSARR